MSTSDKIALAGVIVTGVGVVVTGFLTFWIARLTKQSAVATKESANAAKESAEAAKASNELNKRMIEYQQDKEKRLHGALRNEYKDKVIRASQDAQKALKLAYFRPNGEPRDLGAMNIAPRTHGLTEEKLAEFFIKEEIEQIKIAWDTYSQFVRDHYATTYSGEQLALAEKLSVNPIAAFNHLFEVLK